ncbi:type 1 glutamine amidotransferase [Microbulbifer sp. VTAC004]|uniref:type 1 glutamine amidotransferase n=1 Tax=Microbulbifer sp. VTAC004 TaxID=3243386 RepID=UPI00403A5FD4
MGKHILIIQHEETEGAGYISDWARDHHVSLTTVNPQNSHLPKGQFDGIILLGGMMNVDDRHKLPWLADEIEWLKGYIEQAVPILGICLGAQILAYILGANIRPLDQEEMGWLPIKGSHKLNLNIEKVFQAHSYYFDIPIGAERLAESEQCPNQAFLFKEKVLGIQFHLEWSQKVIAALFPGFYKSYGSPQSNHIASKKALFRLLNTHFAL